MAMQAAKRFSVKTDASVFKRLGRGNQEVFARNQIRSSTSICKYWLEGRCTRNPCRFFHPQPPKSKHSKLSWKNPKVFKSENSPPIENAQQNILKNKLDPKVEQKTLAQVDVNQIKSILKTKEKALTSKVNNVGQSESILKTEEKMLNSKVNVSQTEDILKTEENMLTSKVNAVGQSESIPKRPKLCNQWVTNSCTMGDKCNNLHSWFGGDGLSMVARLGGHTKAITGIILPSGSNKLYSCSKDKSLRIWDCNSGKCGAVLDFDHECGTLVNEAPWIFVGLQDMIKGWNLNTQQEVVIRGKGGRVNAITMFEDTLFAGMENGIVLSWKSTSETSFSEYPTSLVGHTGSVLSLVVGAKRLFSGSADHTIRVWNAASLECEHVLNGHTGDVTTVLCWDQFLLSGSLDKKIKIWASTESGSIEQVYQHSVDDGVVAFCGMHDAENKPILLCSCKDNSVCLYDLPSFVERGCVYSRTEAQAIQIGPGGLFFTGDAEGTVSVWKLEGKPKEKCS